MYLSFVASERCLLYFQSPCAYLEHSAICCNIASGVRGLPSRKCGADHQAGAPDADPSQVRFGARLALRWPPASIKWA